MDDNLILGKLNILIYDGARLKGNLIYHHNDISNKNREYEQEAKKWKGAAINLLRLRFGKDSEYYQDFMSNINYLSNSESEFCKENVQRATGVLEYVHDALQNGLTEDLFYKREILILSDLLDQAYEFLRNGLKLAAGIYGRIVLETTIKEFAKKKNINDIKFNEIIIKLKTETIIQPPFEDLLRANYRIGSQAAHGDLNFMNKSDSEIKEFLTFIRDRVLTLQ